MDAIMGCGVALLISLVMVVVCGVGGWKARRRRCCHGRILALRD
jgi:hypothetical protein